MRGSDVRLAVVVSHPTQYYSPWFRHMASRIRLKVFYLWDFGVKETTDASFKRSFAWDIPLLEGYESEFIENRSQDPGTHHFGGLDNPEGVNAVHRWNPDAILIFGYNYRTHLRLILSRKLRAIPMFFRGDSHELDPAAGLKSRVGRELRRLLFKRFEGFMAVGKANRSYFRGCGVPDHKIHHVPHCVDNDRFEAGEAEGRELARSWRLELGIPPDVFVILFAGKFEPKKCPLDLLEAFLDVEEKLPRAVLLFVGNGMLESELREAAGDLLDRKIFFAPFQNQSQMPKVYASADVFVLPSKGRGETWGLAINEVFNFSLPAIVSNHVGSGPDLVNSGETGWIFPAGDIEALAACVSEAVSNPARTKDYGRNAKLLVKRFSYEKATDGVVGILERAAVKRH